MKMKPAAKEAWIEALESDKFAQGRHALKHVSFNGQQTVHCCLGVLVECVSRMPEFAELGVLEAGRGTTGCSYFFSSDEEGFTSELPRSIRTVIGLDDRAQSRLIYMNDTGRSFKEIAEYIRENL